MALSLLLSPTVCRQNGFSVIKVLVDKLSPTICRQNGTVGDSLSTRTFITLKPFCLQTVGDSLSTRTFITLKPFCLQHRMAWRCTRRSPPNYFVMTSYHWNAGKTNLCKQCKYSVCLTLIHLYYVSRIHGHIMISKEIVSMLTNLYNTLRNTTLCAWRHVICCRSFTNVTLLLDHFQCHCQAVANHL
jgi:hypothetical protein